MFLVPKPPPTSLVTTRSLSGGIFRIVSAITSRRRARPGCRACSVIAPVAASYSPRARARLHVIGDDARIDDLDASTLRGAVAKTASVFALSPICVS